ncbi:MAG TPA: CHAD domain-containing protein [Candidatus Binataceae bacterium]|nr:CHAD domain-containing protein [Candidatus Binataceae bacterium]
MPIIVGTGQAGEEVEPDSRDNREPRDDSKAETPQAGDREASSSFAEISSEAATEEQQAVAAAQRRRTSRPLRKAVRRFIELIPQVLETEDADAVHDVRVWSRRVQQALASLAGGIDPARAKSMKRTLRRARRSLGDWRTCDVVLEALARKIRSTKSLRKRHAWELVRDSVQAARKNAIKRARRRLRKLPVLTLVHDARTTAGTVPASTERDGAATRQTIADALKAWDEALAGATESLNVADVHAFRIRNKRLRYRIEIARDLGWRGAADNLKRLVQLQDRLGKWHDHVELQSRIAQSLADPDMILSEPRAAALLVREIERGGKATRSEARAILKSARENVGRAHLAQWIEELATKADGSES